MEGRIAIGTLGLLFIHSCYSFEAAELQRGSKMLKPTGLWAAMARRSAAACRLRFAHTQASGQAPGQAGVIQKMSINEWSDAFKKVRRGP